MKIEVSIACGRLVHSSTDSPVPLEIEADRKTLVSAGFSAYALRRSDRKGFFYPERSLDSEQKHPYSILFLSI
jgi:hypothetical protein